MATDSATCPISPQSANDIAARLSEQEELWVPLHVQRGTVTKREYVHDLLSRDPGVFLERHGQLLSDEEKKEFEELRNTNYEVDFYLGQLNQPVKLVNGSISTIVKNRRFAKMEALMSEGEYFSVEEMRQRQPYLYHLYVGQYTKLQEVEPTVDTMDAGPYELASEIMKQHDEEDVVNRAIEEQNLYEEINDTELHGSDSVSGLGVSDVYQNQHIDAFLDCMQQLFLAGKDRGIDYARIDRDTSLDDCFDKEKTNDLEEAYFDADD